MEHYLRKTGWCSIIISVIFAIIGVVLISSPEETLIAVTYIFGIIAIIIGIVRIINYFLSKERYSIYNYELAYGIVAIVIGILVIIFSDVLEAFFRIMLGIWIIYSGLMRLEFALNLKRSKLEIWYIGLIAAIIMIICGIYVLMCPGAIIMAIGAIILVYAIMDLIEGLIFIKNINKINK